MNGIGGVTADFDNIEFAKHVPSLRITIRTRTAPGIQYEKCWLCFPVTRDAIIADCRWVSLNVQRAVALSTSIPVCLHLCSISVYFVWFGARVTRWYIHL